METVLEILASNPGLWAFLMLLSCGLGGPPWSEEVVLLGTGYFVAQGDVGFAAATAWCFAGILAGDSILWSLGRFAGDRVYTWPLLRRSFKPARRQRFNRFFLRYGARAVFFARFVPGIRLWAYLVAGNLGMPWWKFALLDTIGAVLTVPISIWLGQKFAENLGHVQELLHRFQIPIAIVAVLGIGFFLLRLRKSRGLRLARLRRERQERDAAADDADE